MPRSGSRFLIFALAAVALLPGLIFPGEQQNSPRQNPETSLDVLLDQNRRQVFAAELAKREHKGKTFAWDRYVDWGRQLVTTGQVRDPPVEPSPSEPLAEKYRCVHCHNLVREDEKLTVQDPERREKLIRLASPKEPEKRDGTVLSLTPGTTFWGVVNRERYYNGRYERYRKLPVADGRAMDPESLADAIQICCHYCSSGRFPAAWELDSLHAFLWSLELRLKDLDLPEKDAQDLLKQLQSEEEATVGQARQAIQKHYLRQSTADKHDEPERSKDAGDFYGDGTTYVGDAGRGRLVYRSACAGCHGGDLNPQAGADLVANDRLFHRYVWRGTERDGLYMPLFTQQRLSRQQAADIRVYLRSLKDQER